MLEYHPNGTVRVTVYDGDAFERHNIKRQIHDSGTKADRMNELLEKQLLTPVCKDQYMSEALMKSICRKADDGVHLVIAAVDNDATRKMCLNVLEESGNDFLFLSPGNSDASDPDIDIRGNVLWYGKVNGEEIGINPILLFPNIERPQDAVPRKGSCLENAVSSPQIIAANILAAAYTLTVLQDFLDDRMPYQASHLFFNGRTLQLTVN